MKLKKSIIKILPITIMLIANLNSQEPQVSLKNFTQYSFPLVDIDNKFYGNVSSPAWSGSDDYVAVTFFDPESKARNIIVYNNNRRGEPIKINTANSRSLGGRSEISNDTHHPLWSPLADNVVYVISRIKRNDYLHKISLIQSSSGLSVERIDRLHNNYTPIINYSFSNKSGGLFTSNAYLIMHSGIRENLDIALFNVDDRGQKSPPKINNDQLSEFESDCYINASEISLVIQGFDNNQSDLYHLQGTLNQLGMTKNITKSTGYNERLPKFNRNGTSLAYLRSKNVSKDESKNEILIHSLHVYNIENKIDKQLDGNVYVVPDIFYQTPFIWIDENTIIYIDNNFEEKYPLITVNVLSGEKNRVASQLINHKELAISNSGKKLGIIAKGQDDNPDMDFDKLYIADIEF